MTSTTNTFPESEPTPQKADLPKALFVFDIEGSGLNVRPRRLDANGRVLTERAHHLYVQHKAVSDWRHEPGEDPDCILEVAYAVLDPYAFEETERGRFLVLPPGVTGAKEFDDWCEKLKVADTWCYETHTKSGLLAELREVAGKSRNTDAETGFEEYTYSHVEALLRKAIESAGAPKDAHPGNSPVMLLGNSIANYDIPMFRMWMPSVLRVASYRIMDVSVLRSFTGLAGIELPGKLNAAIKSGGGGHRALDDVLHCAEAFRKIVAFFDGFRVPAYDPTQHELEFLNERVAHLEMLIRYGRRGAIKDERKLIEMRDVPNVPPETKQGIFKGTGGILKVSAEEIEDTPSSRDLADLKNGNGM